ncbi:aldo/keto reductase [Mariniflexile litorale]|uniref:Aldo/keto reductase n=1 Tax=Mariniflexile litorale TaxID=3045158 RepID=A0AAU7EJT2_9FLAO|nr:aldo/keto reductase [Mariniflexile sp. KMM 9835]MDQ8211330.1 aldo/keto reductase [Mariniflexile sp. KMM 9835]
MKNKLILGTVQLGLNYGINNKTGKPSLQNAFEILHLAYDEGLRILDTAEAYGDSQEVIGKFQKENPNKIFNIITKLATNNTLRKGGLLKQIDIDCQILGVNQLYGYMFHNYESFKNNTYFYNELLLAREKGIIIKAGISLYSNDEIKDILDNYPGFDFIQIPFNALDNASKRKNLFIRARNMNIEVHTRSVFLQGLLFKNSNNLTEVLKPLRTYIKKFESIKVKSRLNTETLALQYVLEKEYIDFVLFGVENSEQLMNNIIICEKKVNIPHDSIDAIDVKEINLLNPSNWN